jgi:hypothetical protein
MAKPDPSRRAAVRRKLLPLRMPTLTLVITTIRNMSLGPRSMVPMMERPARGVR